MNTEKPTPPAVVLSTALLNPLPCPFCGHVGLDFREGTTFRWLLAECGGCGATCGETRIQTLGEGTRDEWMQQAQQDAIEVWNMRFNAMYRDKTCSITSPDQPQKHPLPHASRARVAIINIATNTAKENEMTTPNIEELIAILEATNQFHDDADICTADVIAALQSQAERINDLEAEAEQLRKGHFDTSEANAVRAAASCCAGGEIMSLPPLPPTSTFQRFDHGKTVQAHTDAAMREYGALCRKAALGEARVWQLHAD